MTTVVFITELKFIKRIRNDLLVKNVRGKFEPYFNRN
jgi:hypothetical protein